MPKYSRLTGKFLELFAAGFLLGLVKDKNQRRELFKESDRIWYTMDRKELYSTLNRFKMRGYVEAIKSREGIEKICLTNRGRARWLEYQFRNLEVKKKKKWDKKWRLVLFDIPESKKKTRDALRHKLKELGFLEFQKSVFLNPYPCRDEINFVIIFFGISDNVYYLETVVSPDDSFRSHFGLK